MLERDDFAKRYADGVADLADGVPLPAAPGHRLGRDPRRRRARRHRPALQPARRPPPARAAPARSRRSCSRRRCSSASTARKKMSKSLGNYVGHRRAAGRAVRQADVDPRRRAADVLPVRDRVAARRRRRDDRAASLRASCTRTRRNACSPARSSTCTTAPARARRPKPSSTGCSRRTKRPTEMPEHVGRRWARTLVEAPGHGGLAPSKREARRLIEQDAVKIDGARGHEDGEPRRGRTPYRWAGRRWARRARWGSAVGCGSRPRGPRCRLTRVTRVGSLAPRPARRLAPFRGRRNDGTG